MRLTVISFVALPFVLVAPVLWAGTINVPADFATIQEAIDAASPLKTVRPRRASSLLPRCCRCG